MKNSMRVTLMYKNPGRATSVHVIIVRKSAPGVYVAYFLNEKEKWEAGSSAMEALGKLIVTYKQEFDIVLKEEE